MSNRIQVGLIEFNSEQYMESIALRDNVLRKPIGLKYSEVDLKSEKSEHHIAATDGNQLVGILLLRPLSNTHVKMRQVAVHPNQQGKGIGKLMVEFAEELAANMGFTTMELHAREVAVNFYLNQQYQIVGPQFEEVGIPHFKMTKELGAK